VWKSSGPAESKYSVKGICLIGNNPVLQRENSIVVSQKLSECMLEKVKTIRYVYKIFCDVQEKNRLQLP